MAGTKETTTAFTAVPSHPTTTTTTTHVRNHSDAGEHPEHEAVLAGVVALANLFSNCVEAFELVHPGHRFDKQEQLLLCALGLQQARLLIWGDVVGVTSPPASVTDRAVPKHPSAAYPDLKEPTFFNARDPRLDEPETRQKVDDALSAIVDRSAHTSREEMMEKYGLKPPKRFTADHHSALDIQRLEGFRERYELLKEVAESYAHINARRNGSIVSTTWMISDFAKCATFIQLTQAKVDVLIDLLGVRERVDRGMRMDIRALGWHLSADRARVAMDTSKLRLIAEVCKDEYPEYVEATVEALRNIERERRENAADYNPYSSASYAPVSTPHSAPSAAPAVASSGRGSISAPSGNGLINTNDPEAAALANGKGTASPGQHKKHGIFGGLFKRRSSHHTIQARNLSVSDDPPRSMSDVGPAPSSREPLFKSSTSHNEGVAPASLQTGELQPDPERDSLPAPVRSKSVGDILDAPINTEEHEETRLQLEQMKTNMTDDTVADDEGPTGVGPLDGSAAYQSHVPAATGLMATISVHDQYHGLGRQATKTQSDALL